MFNCLVTKNVCLFVFFFAASSALLQKHLEFNRVLWKHFLQVIHTCIIVSLFDELQHYSVFNEKLINITQNNAYVSDFCHITNI